MSYISLDIETIPNEDMIQYLPEPEVKTGNLKDEAKIQAKIEQAKEKQIADMALNPFFGRVASYSFVNSEGDTSSVIENPIDDKSESFIIECLLGLITGVIQSDNTIVTWNGNAFDLPFIYKRAMMLGVELPEDCPVLSQLTKRYTVHPHLDLALALNGWQNYLSLNSVAMPLLREGKIDFDVTLIKSMIENGEGDKVLQYNRHDAELTYRICEKASKYLF